MSKPILWSPLAHSDFADLLEYLEANWNTTICINFIEILDLHLIQIQKNPTQFPFLNKELQIRKCVVTKHNSLYYRETEKQIEILRIYDTRQNPENLKFF
jgi:plasmid stabilization system protein ParE